MGVEYMQKNTNMLDKIFNLLDNWLKRATTSVMGKAFGMSPDMFLKGPAGERAENEMMTKIPRGSK
jgi:hypothetical protein